MGLFECDDRRGVARYCLGTAVGLTALTVVFNDGYVHPQLVGFTLVTLRPASQADGQPCNV